MAEVTAQMIKDLRERTGAGMADCKKALTETPPTWRRRSSTCARRASPRPPRRRRASPPRATVAQLHARRRASACSSRSTARPTSSRATPTSWRSRKEVAMQVAAMNPQYVSQDEIPPAVLEKEKAIRIEQAKQSGKPEAVHPEDRRRPDREVGQGGLPARSGVGEGSGGQEGHPRRCSPSSIAKTGENVACAASSASRSARGWRSAPTTSPPK